ncbi:hypothetical protein SAMN00790413_00901 [Deinococcus hopiensis KR-140]|uniref:Uncharacterized protein n=1 Tax=Deinococcus hopiensis KR-140 TaxID=695939 RepID=A0A1W1VBS6_9DEIO|nr:hypothetical protein SAMN00790413_00901 [Deinococcus hopiensis KR-140]
MKPEDLAAVWEVGQVRTLRPLKGGSINGAYRVRAERGESFACGSAAPFRRG